MRAESLQYFNVGGTFITDVSILAIASHCKLLKVLESNIYLFRSFCSHTVVACFLGSYSLVCCSRLVRCTFKMQLLLSWFSVFSCLVQCINLWCCRHVTETGLLALIKGCPDLEFMNVWGMSISPSCRRLFKLLNTKLELKPQQADHLV